MAHIIDLTIRIVAMKPSSARKLADLIEDRAEQLFEEFTMRGRDIGPVSMGTEQKERR
jgi:hypothetical protein